MKRPSAFVAALVLCGAASAQTPNPAPGPVRPPLSVPPTVTGSPFAAATTATVRPQRNNARETAPADALPDLPAPLRAAPAVRDSVDARLRALDRDARAGRMSLDEYRVRQRAILEGR